VGLGVRRRHRGHVGEGISRLAQAIAQRLFAGGDELLRICFARPDVHEPPQGLLGHGEFSGQLHRAGLPGGTLEDIDGDEQVLLVRRQRNLRGGDLELRVAAIHVVGPDLLEVAFELLFRILVVAAVERQPVGPAELQAREQFLVAESFVAGDIDLADARAFSLGDVDVHVDQVAAEFVYLRVDLHVVVAAREILLVEELAHVLERRAVQDLARGQADGTQRLLEILGPDRLVALDLEAADRRVLLHYDDQHARILAAELDVAEESHVVHRAQRLADALAVDPVADVHGQCVEQGAFGNALQAFDADVGDRERAIFGARGAGQH
jgi:hypothetical protein